MDDDQNGGEWYQDDWYVRNHRRQVALAHCQDKQIAEQIVREHNAIERLNRLVETLTRARARYQDKE